MNIEGSAAGAVAYWGHHLMREKENDPDPNVNDRVRVIEISGLLSTTVEGALREMEAVASGSRSHGNFMYQANLNPQIFERLNAEQWREAVDILANELGMEGHQRVIVEHEKKGRLHGHVIFNRVDVDTMKVKDITGNYYAHERAAERIEQKFGLERTPKPHLDLEAYRDRRGKAKLLDLSEIRAGQKTGIDPDQIKAELTDLWRKVDSGKAFAAAVEDHGYILAQGNRRNFCIVDHAGTAHSLARRIDGAKAKDVNERLADIDRGKLPTVDAARDEQREKYPTKEQAQEAWRSRSGAADYARQQEQTAAPQRDAEKEPERENKPEKPKRLEPQWEAGSGASWTDRKATKTEEKISFILNSAEHGGKNVGAALYEAGLTLARVDSAGRLKFEQEHQPETEAKDPWMKMVDGAGTLKEEDLASAQKSYAAWAEAKPKAAAKYNFENYVGYVQEKWAQNEQGEQQDRRPAPFKDGELVAVSRRGDIHQLNPRFLDRLDKLEREATGGGAKTPLLSSALEHFATGPQQRREVHKPAGDLSQAHADIRLAWSLGRSGEGFAERLEDKGYILARVTADEAYASERRQAFAKEVGNTASKYREGEIVVVSGRGAVYRLDGKTTGLNDREAIDKFTATIDPANFLSVTDAKEVQKEARAASFRHEQTNDKPFTAIETKIDRLARFAKQGDTPLPTALYNAGIALARVDAAGKVDVQREYDIKFYEARIAGDEAAKQRQASFLEGELVAVTKRGEVHRLNPKHFNHDHLEQAACGRHGAQSLSAAREFFATERAADKAERHQQTQDFWKDVKENREERGRARDIRQESRAEEAAYNRTVKAAVRAPGEAVKSGAKATLKVATAGGAAVPLGKFLEGILGMSAKPPPSDGNEAIRQQRKAHAALQKIAESMERGDDLRASDVANLLPTQLENLKRRGDDYMREIIDRVERDRDRDARGHDYGRQRDR